MTLIILLSWAIIGFGFGIYIAESGAIDELISEHGIKVLCLFYVLVTIIGPALIIKTLLTK
jgi:hypothetical protein